MADVINHPRAKPRNIWEEALSFSDGTIVKIISPNSRAVHPMQQVYMLEEMKADIMTRIRFKT